MPEPARCEGCRYELVADIIRCGTGRWSFCASCRQQRPFCHSCQAPVGASLFLKGRTICCRCFGDLRRCDACGREGGEEMREVISSPRFRLCGDCSDVRVARCTFCESTGIVNDLQMCRACQDKPPPTEDGLDAIIWEVRKFLEEAFGMGLRRNFKLEMADHIDPLPTSVPGSFILGTFCLHAGQPRITLRRGLPEPELMAVFAHEYTHAWQFENCPPQSQELLEGFARWVERKVLFELYEDHAAGRLELDIQPDYGPGLRACLAWERRLGEKGLIMAVKGWTEFPPLPA